MPGLVGVGGLALIVPFSLPGSAAGYGWLVGSLAAACAVSVGIIRLHSSLRRVGTLRAASMASAGAALLSLAGWFVFQRAPLDFSGSTVAKETVWALVIDLPLVLLTIWLLPRLRPIAFSSRFLLAPLVTIIGGMLLIRPSTPWTTWLGLVLIAAAGWTMLRENGPEKPPKVV